MLRLSLGRSLSHLGYHTAGNPRRHFLVEQMVYARLDLSRASRTGNTGILRCRWNRNRKQSEFLEGIARQTHNPIDVLQDSDYSANYNVEKRIDWTMHRRTKREEDAAYCLLGFFGVQMPLIYGEGSARAFARLRTEIKRHRFQQNLQTVVSFMKLLYDGIVNVRDTADLCPPGT
ncbi:unnamed protein product [Alternaria alternata]